MKELEINTFGKSKSAHDIVDILNSGITNDSNRLVSRILSSYFLGVKDILKTDNHIEVLLTMWLKKYSHRIDNSSLNIDIKTRLHNIVVTRFRSELKRSKSNERVNK